MKLVLVYLSIFLTSFHHLSAQLRVKQVHQIHSQSLGEKRHIEVSLPESYHSSTETYGVLYVLDGEYVFDYALGTVSFLSNDFGYLPPLIVVNIPNIDRQRDMNATYSISGEPQRFLKMISHELMPFIEKTYRVNGFNLLYGWSSASNINMQFLAYDPGLFDAHIQTGTGIDDKTEQYLTKQMTDSSYNNCYLYANVEGSGPRVAGLLRYKNLLRELSTNGLHTKFEVMDSSSHVSVIADGIYRGLQFVFGAYYVPESVVLQGFDKTLDYYKELTKIYGYEVSIPVGAIIESAGVLIQNKEEKEAVHILHFGIERYPFESSIAGTLAEYYEQTGNELEAAKYYEIAYKKAPIGSYDAIKYRNLQKKMK